jgi:DNA topoisomerase I
LRATRAEGLQFSSDLDPGIRRVRHGAGFIYRHPSGRRVREAALLARIRSLAIPPAYQNVWICSSPRGHLQATGRDARGRKQYRYHARWRSHRDSQKFDRILAFGGALPRIRRRVAQDLRKSGLPRERVLATLVRLLDKTLIRVGNEEYVRANNSFGLTTLRNRHVRVSGNTLQLEFRGKSGIFHRVRISDPKLARLVRRCADIPGQELFQYLDSDGNRHRIGSNDVNEYLREVSGDDFTAKDFRTWYATTEALGLLRKLPVGSQREVKRHLKSVIAAVAARLRNTPTICRKCYIHPEVLLAFSEGRLTGLTGNTTNALKVLLRKRSRQLDR